MKKCLEISLFAMLVLASAMGVKALTVSSIGDTTAAQSGRPVPRLAQSGRPVPRLAQSGRPVPRLAQSGRPVPR